MGRLSVMQTNLQVSWIWFCCEKRELQFLQMVIFYQYVSMLPTRLAQTTAYALSHQAWDHFLNKIKQRHITHMFMLLNTATIGIINGLFPHVN